MKSLSSALILSNNFTVSSTLTGILKKSGIKKVFEIDTDMKALSNILNSKPEYIFFDFKAPDYTSIETALQLDAFSGAQIGVLSGADNLSEWEQKLNSYPNIQVLKKPLIAKEVETFITNNYASFFYGEAI